MCIGSSTSLKKLSKSNNITMAINLHLPYCFFYIFSVNKISNKHDYFHNFFSDNDFLSGKNGFIKICKSFLLQSIININSIGLKNVSLPIKALVCFLADISSF